MSPETRTERLRQADTWVFDLDNTLYPPSANLFGQINALMIRFIARALGVDEAEANRLRLAYWTQFGNTMSGLIAHHGISSEAFLHETHQLDLSGLSPDPALRHAIANLPGRRLIHTNGPSAHAERVLAARGLTDLFAEIIAIEDTDLTPKPQARAYDMFLSRTGIKPARTVMVEDHVENLAEPHSREMTTVWLAHGNQMTTPGYVDYRTEDLTTFLLDCQRDRQL